MRRELSTRTILIGCTLADAYALWAMLVGRTTAAVAIGVALHVTLCLCVYGTQPAGSRRTLLVGWMISLPGVGLPVAQLTMHTQTSGELQEFARGALPARSVAPAQIVRAIAGHVPICERLVSGVSRTRRAALNSLAARRDAESLEILRWAVRHSDGELALDAALTLDELTTELEEQRAESTRRIAEKASFENLVAAGDILTDALWTRMIDDAMVVAVAAEATAYYDQARALAPERASEVTVSLAKIALVTMRPQEALNLLRPAMNERRPARSIYALYNHAIAAARQFGTIQHPESDDAVA